MKYLLSTGYSTNKIEYYILDLFKLYLGIYPKDIPGAPNIGFNFILGDTKKDELVNNINSRINELINKIKSNYSDTTTTTVITLKSIEIIDESRVRITIDVNSYIGEIEKNIYDN